MSIRHRIVRLLLLAAVWELPFGLTARTCAQSLTDLARVGIAESRQPQFPRSILIIRHAEKPGDSDDPHLSSRGAARAAALTSLFYIPPTFPTMPAPYQTPDLIMATRKSNKSNRPVETVTPLAKALGDMHIHDKHSDDDFQAIADEVFSAAKYADKTILICWHHGKMPKLAQAILNRATNAEKIKTQDPSTWKIPPLTVSG